MSISENTVEEVAYRLLCKAATELPSGMRQALERAYEKEQNPVARGHLSAILKSSQISKEKGIPLCQDTGIPLFFLDLGTKCSLDGNINQALINAVKRATADVPLRHNITHPISHVNTDTNTGYRIPPVYTDLIDGQDYLEITAITKGLGSEARSTESMVLASEDTVKAIKKCVLDEVRMVMGDPCPPVIIGVGVGGVADYNLKLAKRALFREPIGAHNPDPEIAALEEELLNAINSLNIGPMGFGGNTYAIAVNIEIAGKHTGVTPVGVTLQCWAHRYSKARIYNDGSIEYLTHPY